MWSRDYWAEGARLFAKRQDGRRRSLQECGAIFAARARQAA